ncbi:hypothetical protein T492DRAFT_1021667 [Pavlovales sp. CCMP2436]|nr:hypothetical protein T492DRAFT_1021667 [Pavlovales sp. CCMP2436]
MSGVELLEVVQLRAGPGSGFDDWFVEHEQRGGGLGFTAGAPGYGGHGGGGGHGEQLDLFPPPPPRGGGQYSESDRFAPPGAIVLEPSAYQAWHQPARDQPHRPLRADAPDDDDISAHVDELISALQSDRLSFGFDDELPDARPPGGGRGGFGPRAGSAGRQARAHDEAGYEAGYGSAGDAMYGEELTPDCHEGALSPARRADGGKMRLVRQTLTYRTSSPAYRTTGALRSGGGRRGWDDSVSKPLDARADDLKRREQHARHHAFALTARLLDARSARARGGEGGGGSGMPLLRAQLAELQGQLSAEAGRDAHLDAFFRAQLRRLHRLQAEASRLDAQTHSAGAKGAGVSEAARVSRQVLQEELEALLQDLHVDEPDAYARFAPAVKPLPPTLKPTPRVGGHSLAPGWLQGGGGGEVTPALFTQEGASAVAKLLQLIDAAQENELEIANKWRNVWKEPLYSPMEAANEVDDAAAWLAYDDGRWHAQAAASSAAPARSRSRSPARSPARAFPSRAQPPRPQASSGRSTAFASQGAAPAYVPVRPRPPLAEVTVSSILGQAHTRELLLRREAEAMGGLQTNLAEIESAMAERLLDEVLREQAGSLERAAAAVVDRLCESELGPLSSAPAYR